jgi:hypothetical protein
MPDAARLVVLSDSDRAGDVGHPLMRYVLALLAALTFATPAAARPLVVITGNLR